MGLFKVEHGILTLSQEELRAVPEFNKILRRDRGKPGTGDHDGREKRQAFKEFMYIYFYCDFESPYGKLDEDERRKRAVKDAQLEDNFKPDKELRIAMAKYLEIQDALTPSAGLLAAAEIGLSLSTKLCNSLNTRIQRQLTKLEALTESDAANNTITIPDLQPIINDINTLMALAERIPTSMSNIAKLKELVATERSSAVVVRGKRAKGNREDPGYMIHLKPNENAQS